MKTGLVLEGGAMRGMFTAGVMDVLMENGIRFDGAIGVSAGAAFGCNYKSGQIGRVIRYNTKFIRDTRYCGFNVLLKTGNYYSTEFCYKEVPLKYDPFDYDAFKRNPMEFYIVCTDINTGRPVYHLFEGDESENFDEWIRASTSMPMVSEIVNIDGMELLDGGITDSIPIKYFQSIGYEKNIVILTQPRGYMKKPNMLMPLIRHKYKKYPKLVEAMERRHKMYNDTTDYILKQAAEGNIFVIRPEEKLPVSRVEREPEKLQMTYDIGRKCAQSNIDKIISYMGIVNR